MAQVYDGLMLHVDTTKDVTVEISTNGRYVWVCVGATCVLTLESPGTVKLLDHRPAPGNTDMYTTEQVHKLVHGE